MTPWGGGWWIFLSGAGRGGAAEVTVFESVAVSFEGDDFGVVHQPVDHGGGHDVVAEYSSPQRPNGLLEVTMRLARSYRDETSWKNRLAASVSNKSTPLCVKPLLR